MAKNYVEIVIRAFDDATKKFKTVDKAIEKTGKTAKKTSEGMQMLGKAVAAVGFAALAKQAGKFVIESTKLAARVETLGVVTQTLGKTAGYAGSEIIRLERAIQDQGITTQASRQALAQMMQAQLDLADATELARLAQDAAVIAGVNSSEAFQRLINVITTGNVRMARTMGLQVNFNKGYEEMAEQLGKTADELTAQEKAQSRTNTVMGQGKQIAGAYTNAMDSVGKQLESTARYTEEFKVSFGKANVEVMGWANLAWQDFLKTTTEYLDLTALKEEAERQGLITSAEAHEMSGQLMADEVTRIEQIEILITLLDEHRRAKEDVIGADAVLLSKNAELTESFALLGKGVAGFAPKSEIGIKALENFTTAALGAVQINKEVEIAAVGGFTEEELSDIENMAAAWGIDLPDSFREAANNFNVTQGTLENGMDILITQVAVYNAALRNAARLEADLLIGADEAGKWTPPPKYKPQARGGKLADMALVGEEGYELIINGIVIPHDESKKMLSLGMAIPDKAYGTGGRLDPMVDGGFNVPDWTKDITFTGYHPPHAQRARPGATPPPAPPPPKLKAPDTASAQAANATAQQSAQAAADAAADMNIQMEILAGIRDLATAEDIQESMTTALELAML